MGKNHLIKIIISLIVHFLVHNLYKLLPVYMSKYNNYIIIFIEEGSFLELFSSCVFKL